jgi:hypothetical protein
LKLDGPVSNPPSRRPGRIASLLRNPLVIIAAAAVVGLSGVALALLTANQPRPSDLGAGSTLLAARATPTSTTTASLRARAAVTGDVHTLPSEESQILGTLRRGQELDIIGRSSDGQWIAIAYPPGSAQQGWIPALAADLPLELRVLPTVTPAPFRGADSSASLLPTVTSAALDGPPPTPVAPGRPLPDLVISNVGLLADGRLVATVRNQGNAMVDGRPIEIALASANGQILRIAGTEPRQLGPGQSVDIVVNYPITQPTAVRILVDPNGRVEELSRANDVFEASVQPPAQATAAASSAATHTPTAVATPPPAMSVTPRPATPVPPTATISPTTVVTTAPATPTQTAAASPPQSNGARSGFVAPTVTAGPGVLSTAEGRNGQ